MEKKIATFENKIVIPYIIYQDDFEVNNPFGSKRGIQKISAFYLSFPVLEKHNISKLDNILVCCLIRSIHLKYGSAQNFNHLVSQLIELENEGITIIHYNKPINIYLVLAAITGDNLGLNTVLGCSRSFLGNYFCRIWKAHKDQNKTLTKENTSLLRSQENYEKDILSSNPSVSGVNEKCVLSQIKSFSVVDNVTVD